MTDGDTVVAVDDGCSTGGSNNHPIVLSAERESTWNGGNFDWPNTTHNAITSGPRCDGIRHLSCR